jgi:7-carboxy-7-deazaguanine synthase (Cx14CxxC type)
MTVYSVKELFLTKQGEGAHAGRLAVFLRFSGCNLWSGLEKDRQGAICRFCDTDFVGVDGHGGGKFKSAEALAAHCAEKWPKGVHSPYLVATGGEPLLQLDAPAIRALQAHGFTVAVETNGTVAAPPGLDWICVSPKADARLAQHYGNELKLVFPQDGVDPRRFADLAFQHFFLQPMDGPDRAANTLAAARYCIDHPRWRLSIQTHKLLGIP